MTEDEKRKVLVKFLSDRTAAFATGSGYVKEPEPKSEEESPMSVVATDVADLCKKLGGCMEADMRKLMEAVINLTLMHAGMCDETVVLPAPKFVPVKGSVGKRVQYLKWAVIIVEDNPNSHNYPIGSPCVCYTVLSEAWRAHALRYGGGSEGNWLPDRQNCVRPAEAHEIESCVTDILENWDESMVRKMIEVATN